MQLSIKWGKGLGNAIINHHTISVLFFRKFSEYHGCSRSLVNQLDLTDMWAHGSEVNTFERLVSHGTPLTLHTPLLSSLPPSLPLSCLPPYCQPIGTQGHGSSSELSQPETDRNMNQMNKISIDGAVAPALVPGPGLPAHESTIWPSSVPVHNWWESLTPVW